MTQKHFANFWDLIHNVQFAQDRALMVLKLIKKFNYNAKNVLELGVGTGNVLKHFKDTFKVYGLDIEQEYIDICKTKISNGNFFLSFNDFTIRLFRIVHLFLTFFFPIKSITAVLFFMTRCLFSKVVVPYD